MTPLFAGLIGSWELLFVLAAILVLAAVGGIVFTIAMVSRRKAPAPAPNSMPPATRPPAKG